MLEIEKQDLIQILGIIINKKNGTNRDVVVQHDHLCNIRKIRHLVPGCSGRIDSTSVLVYRSYDNDIYVLISMGKSYRNLGEAVKKKLCLGFQLNF